MFGTLEEVARSVAGFDLRLGKCRWEPFEQLCVPRSQQGLMVIFADPCCLLGHLLEPTARVSWLPFRRFPGVVVALASVLFQWFWFVDAIVTVFGGWVQFRRGDVLI